MGEFAVENLFNLLYHLVVREDTGAPLSSGQVGWLAGGGAVTYLSGDRKTGASVRAAAGMGLQVDFSGSPEFYAQAVPVMISPSYVQVLAPASEQHARIDRLFVKAVENPGNGFIGIIDPVTKNIADGLKVVRANFDASPDGFAYAQGTPAAVPTAPAPPSGYTLEHCIAEIRVRQGSGPIDAGDITDTRRLLEFHPTMLDAPDTSLASLFGVSAPLADANTQAALVRLGNDLAAIQGDRGLLHHGGLVYTSTATVSLLRGAGLGGTNAEIAIEINGAIVKKSDADLAFSMTLHLDSAEAPSTWYYLYVSNSGGSLIPHISATAPIMPGAGSGKVGYHPTNTNWRFIGSLDAPAAGAIYNDGSSNILPFVARADGWHLRDAIPAAFRVNLGTSEPTVYTAINLASAVPPIAREVQVCVHGVGIGKEIQLGSGFMIGQTVSSTPTGRAFRFSNVSSNTDQASIEMWLALDGSRRVSYGCDDTSDSITDLRLEVLGWR